MKFFALGLFAVQQMILTPYLATAQEARLPVDCREAWINPKQINKVVNRTETSVIVKSLATFMGVTAIWVTGTLAASAAWPEQIVPIMLGSTGGFLAFAGVFSSRSNLGFPKNAKRTFQRTMNRKIFVSPLLLDDLLSPTFEPTRTSNTDQFARAAEWTSVNQMVMGPRNGQYSALQGSIAEKFKNKRQQEQLDLREEILEEIRTQIVLNQTLNHKKLSLLTQEKMLELAWRGYHRMMTTTSNDRLCDFNWGTIQKTLSVPNRFYGDFSHQFHSLFLVNKKNARDWKSIWIQHMKNILEQDPNLESPIPQFQSTPDLYNPKTYISTYEEALKKMQPNPMK